MLPVKKILAPTDFSERSLPALDLAVELAEHFSAELVVLHVIRDLPNAYPAAAGEMAMTVEIHREALLEQSQKTLDELVGERVPDGLPCTAAIAWGRPAETIVERAADDGADLVVIATRGATGLSRFVSGSVTERVVRLSQVPVLTVQAEDDD